MAGFGLPIPIPRAAARILRLDQLPVRCAEQFAPAVKGAVKVRGRLVDYCFEPGVAEPAGVSEGGQIELENAAGPLRWA